MTHIKFPVALFDIGGTHMRAALLRERLPSDTPLKIFPRVVNCHFSTLTEALEHLQIQDYAVKTAMVAVAAPIGGALQSQEGQLCRLSMTNSSWNICPQEIVKRFNLRNLLLFNDFEALSLVLPYLAPPHILPLGDTWKYSPPTQSLLAIGPGTGLGIAGLHCSNIWTPLPSEGGHISLAPQTQIEFAIWPHLQPNTPHANIEAEHLLCGSGLVRIANALCASHNIERSYLDPSSLNQAAHQGDVIAIKTMAIFTELLGRIAGDMALTFYATGGVYIGGGVAVKIAHFLHNDTFRNAFEDKSTYKKFVTNIPTWLISDDNAAVLGLAAYASTPDKYHIDISKRCWYQ